MDKLKRYIAQGKIMTQEIWQKQVRSLQKSGVVNKLIGVAALCFTLLFLLIFGILSLFVFGFLFFVATLQLIFFAKPVHPATQGSGVIIDTTAVKKFTD